MLPLDVVLPLVLAMPTRSVYRFCLTNKHYLQVLYENYFWKKKFENDYLFINYLDINNDDWKEIYRKMYTKIDPIRFCYYQKDILGMTSADKIPIMMYRIKQILCQNPSTKFIVRCSDSKSRELVYNEFNRNKISCASPHEHECIRRFNAPNLGLRAIITVTDMDGIDFGDKDGNYPRHMFILAELSVVSNLRMTARVLRFSNKSKAAVEIINNVWLQKDFSLTQYPNQNIYFTQECSESYKKMQQIENTFKSVALDCTLTRS